MIIFEGYGIQLKRLEITDIELIRYWRNSQHIRRFMEFREEISPEMQKQWFQKINQTLDYYFLITVNGKYIGLINGSDTDWENGITGNGGIFVWEEEYWSTSIPFAAAILLTEFSFNLGISVSRAKILRNNFRSIQFNLALGYKKLPGQDEVENQKYELNSHDFFEATRDARRILSKEYGTQLTFYAIPQLDESEKFLVQQYLEMKGKMISTIELKHGK